MTTNDILYSVYLEIRKEKEAEGGKYYSQIDFANDVNVDKHSIHDWFKNKNQMKFSVLERVLAPLNIKPVIKLEQL